MAESLFEALFKYKPFVFARGDLSFGTSNAGMLLLIALAAVGVVVVRRYAGVGGRTTGRDRAVLAALRLALMLLLVSCLSRPQLVVQTAEPQQNFVGVLLDNSASMRIGDLDGRSRLQVMQEIFGPESALRSALQDRFKLRLFSYDARVRRVGDVGDLAGAGSRTDLAAALMAARDELTAVPLAALVLVGDGADNGDSGLSAAVRELADAGVPVFTVGVGVEEFSRDIEIVRVDAPGRVLRGTAVGADVLLRQRGFDGERIDLTVEEGGRLLARQQVTLSAGGEATLAKVRFVAEESGPRQISYRIGLQPDEMMEQNNRVDRLLDVRDDIARVLYLEGEPRFEVKFLRRAVESDHNLSIALLERTAPNRFYRLFEPDDRFGGDNELFAGFPTSREELFAYSGIVLGSIEADFFTPDQRQMIVDFVSQRGGGLLVLGGRAAFAAGGWGGTALAEALPVVMDEGGEMRYQALRVEPTLAGRGHPAVQLVDDPQENTRRWSALPPLGVVNAMTELKPGAGLLLQGSDEDRSDVVVLAWQRYGAGKSIAFPVVDSWQWQMHHDVPLDDATHETFWQQLLRWLVADVPARVTVRLTPERFAPGDAVVIEADVVDEAHLALNGAEVSARVSGPDGAQIDVPLRWNVDVDGRYEGSFRADTAGAWRVEVQAAHGDQPAVSESANGMAVESEREFFGAELNRELLGRLAADTGGRYYAIDEAGELAVDITYADGGTTVTQSLDLWDMPVVFLAMLALLTAEWAYRKKVRLA